MADIFALADALIGAPYRLHGDDPSGWDCFGCVRWFRREGFGLDTPGRDRRVHQGDPDRAEAFVRGEIKRLVGPVWRSLPAPQPGAMVLFERMGRLDHVGVMLDCRLFLHAQQGTGTVVEDIRGVWGRRVRAYYELA